MTVERADGQHVENGERNIDIYAHVDKQPDRFPNRIRIHKVEDYGEDNRLQDVRDRTRDGDDRTVPYRLAKVERVRHDGPAPPKTVSG